MSCVFRINHGKGKLGNRMFQYMFATAVSRHLQGLKICGLDIPEWKIFDDFECRSLFDRHFKKTLYLSGHSINLEGLFKTIQQENIDCIEYGGWACRIEYYDKPSNFRDLFPTPKDLQGVGFSKDIILVNVRASEILKGSHPDYVPTPISFIDAMIKRSGLTPVFMGQLGDDWYSNLLRHKYRHAKFIASQGAIHDFETIRQSTNVIIPVSTFSWLASWLSDCNENIYMPLIGMYNPFQRPDINLIPDNDKRYNFFIFPKIKWRGDENQLRNLKFSKASTTSIRMRKHISRFFDWALKVRRIL